MTSLPRELARWEAELTIFPHDLALTLGAWIGRLHLAIGPLSDGARGHGEPDGLGDLARRGSYERLLMSEWLLADEMPDEFLRRAAGGEHLFLSPTRRQRSSSTRAIALFDAGPSQLGAPRIAHLALLVVLARRAIDAGARFAWGIVQRPDAGLHESVDPTTVRALLDGRSAQEARDEHHEAWSALLTREAHDLWLVGGSRTARASRVVPRGLVIVEDPFQPGRRALDVRVRRATSEVPIELALPDDATCARLLRDPFAAAVATPAPANAPRDARIALPADGRRLAIATSRGLLSWGLPNSPRGTVGEPRRLEIGKGERLLAVGHRGRRLLAVAARQSASSRPELVLHRIPAAGGTVSTIVVPDLDGIGHIPPGTLGHIAFNALAGGGDAPDLTFHDGRDRLVSLPTSDLTRRPRIWNDVLAMTAVGDGALIVTADERTTTIQKLERGKSTPTKLLSYDRGAATRAFFGAFDYPQRAVVGVSVDPEGRTFQLTTGHLTGWSSWAVPSGTEVIGVEGEIKNGPALVIVDADRREIGVLERSHARVSLRASGKIVDACASARGGIVAWRTEEGCVEVGSLRQDALLMRLPPEDAS